VRKAGAPGVVRNRPRIRLGYRGPVRIPADTHMISFLAISRSLGDLWSYSAELYECVVSPEPLAEGHSSGNWM
jgi:hypothetical protein